MDQGKEGCSLFVSQMHIACGHGLEERQAYCQLQDQCANEHAGCVPNADLNKGIDFACEFFALEPSSAEDPDEKHTLRRRRYSPSLHDVKRHAVWVDQHCPQGLQ